MPARVELLNGQDHSRYLVTRRAEILAVLRAVIAERSLASAYFDEGDAFLLTGLLAIDGEGLIVDCSASADVNARALSASALTFVTTQAHVKVQFACGVPEQVDHEGRPAFRVGLPERLLRLQRREYYRLTTPVVDPPTCALRVCAGAAAEHEVTLHVINLSAGGLAIVAPPGELALEPGERFEDCVIALPRSVPIHLALCVRNAFEITLRNGIRMHRYGCQFAGAPAGAIAKIERYILETERGRKARDAGLA